MGWGQHIDLEWNSKLHRYETTRSLPPGRYPYKFIMDGRWTYSADHPTFTVRIPSMFSLPPRTDLQFPRLSMEGAHHADCCV